MAPVAIAVIVVLALAAGPAAAQSRSSGLLLTIAARSCPSYGDVTANLARNNIMESLRDLGPDTPYRHGEPVDPAIEEQVQPDCKPLPDWKFTLGNTYASRAVSGPWGSLSIIRNQLRAPVVTRAQTQLLDNQGNPTGRQIAGATTIELGPEEAALAPRGSLWIQGGTPTDPVLDQQFPGPEYGFAALRCAIDNVNGDNVEFVSYPAGASHVFCFAYYVVPPPTGGTIVIRKRAIGADAPHETFNFDGNISYNPGGRFSLAPAPGGAASETFHRGATGSGEDPWRVRELAAPDWRLAGLTCNSRDGTSRVTTSVPGASASISLGAEDLVTCTYADEYSPPPEGLVIRKLTEGGTGSFGYTVEPVGGGGAVHATATTEREDAAVDADPSPLNLAPGHYRITERSPHSDAGHWALRAVECGGRALSPHDPVLVTISARAVETCTFTNRFVPRGSITIAKITRGAVGTAAFEISSFADPASVLRQSATTTEPGVAVEAHGDGAGHLALGRYSILEASLASHGGEWRLAEVECNGEVVPFAEGRIEVALSERHPHQSCTFVNEFHPHAEPPAPGPPAPSGAPADLVVTKRLVTADPVVGEAVEYLVSVANRGPGEATGTVLLDQPSGPARLVSAIPSTGSCREGLPLECELGSLAPGAHVTVRVKVIFSHAGRFGNRAVIGTASREETPAAVASEVTATVRPSPPSQPPEPGLG